MSGYKFGLDRIPEAPAERGIHSFTDYDSNEFAVACMRERLATQAAGLSGSAQDPYKNQKLAAQEDDAGKVAWIDPLWLSQEESDGSTTFGYGLSGGVSQLNELYGFLDVDADTAQVGAYTNPEQGLTQFGASATVAQAKIDDEVDEDQGHAMSLGLAAGWGMQGRLHHSDDNANGITEYGIGVDAGPITFDFKTEDPVSAVPAAMFGPLGLLLHEAVMPDDVNVTQALLGDDEVAADDLRSPVQIAKERKAAGKAITDDGLDADEIRALMDW